MTLAFVYHVLMYAFNIHAVLLGVVSETITQVLLKKYTY